MTKQTRRMLKSRAKFNHEVIIRDMKCMADDGYCSGLLEPHHIVGRVSMIDDVKENGITFCSKHHRLVTDGHLKVRASWLTEDQIEWIEKRKWKLWNGITWDRV